MKANKLLKDQLDYFENQTRISLLSLFILSLLIVYLELDHLDIRATLIWIGISSAVLIMRLFVSNSYRKHKESARRVDTTLYYWLFI
ncbi:hypothetical protein [Sulfurovum sp. NBC37-1]|uniref:hypothetical protein n=1 Tax=Sulfurovum sp. (strain NBC37-1) TaxID=387093 RepID=UPI00015878BE|nr:hypothetical protein [Sulfurovum sp. NBC37-1]BAF71717.1 hypothetical protein SUN_0759 [Sulfurovum sp. NBC37-1]